MDPVMMENEMKSIIQYGSTMNSTHISTLQLPGPSKQARQIQIPPKMQIAPLILLGVLCDNVCTTTLDKQEISTHKNGEETIKGTRNKKTGMWEVPLGPQQSENAVNNIMAQTSRPELAQYLHGVIFNPTKASLLKAI